MALTIKDIGKSIQSLFNDDKGFIQRGKLTAQPIRQAFNQSPQVQGFQAIQRAFTPSRPGGGYWTTPSSQALVNIQKSMPAYQKYGSSVFGQDYFKNNLGFQNYIPQMAPFNSRSMKGQVGNAVVNIPSNIVGGIAGTFANLGTDIFRKIQNQQQGKPIVPYGELKSPIARLAYNSKGINNKPQEVLGNTGDLLVEALNMYFPSGGKAVYQVAKQNFAKDFLKQLTKESVKGGKLMFGYGAAQGLSENRNKSLPQQLGGAVKQGLEVAPVGVILGGGTATVGRISGALTSAFEKAGFNNKAAKALARKFLRDAQGKFSKIGKLEKESQWVYPPGVSQEQGIRMSNQSRKLAGLPPLQTAESSIKIPNQTQVNVPQAKQPIIAAPKAQPKFKISKGIPTPEQVASTIEQKTNDLLESTAGYSTLDPVATGNKGGSAYTKVVRKIAGGASSKLEQGLASENPIIRKASATLHGFFKEAGTSPQRYSENLQLKGGLSTANQQPYDVMTSLYDALGKDAQTSKPRIDAVLDPKASKLKIKYSDLNDSEKAVYSLIRQGYDLVHDISYANGNLTPEQYKACLGKYSARMYTDYELPPEVNKFINKAYKSMQIDPYKKRGDLTKWKIENKLDDPIYAMGKRLSQVEGNRAIKRYTDFLSTQPHLISDTPRAGFTKLSDSPAYGKLKGKYVLNSAVEELKGHFFENEMLNHVYDAFRVYDRWTPRQIQKKLLTIFNPTTNIGNITTDNVFGFMVGVDPLTLNTNVARMKSNPTAFRQYSNYLLKKGITGTDITKTDFVNKIGSVDALAQKGVKEPNIFIKATDKASAFYGGTDDVYKVAALKSLLDQGKSLEEATQLVSDGFQNYASVGKFYDFASKTPVIGQTFIKFQGDLMRIIKNAAVNKPLHLISFLATLKAVSYLSSKASGETDEQRVARETRFGAPIIPGLNIPLTWQTPIGEINVARYISPFYATQLSEDNQTSQVANKILPFVPEVVNDKSGAFDLRGTVAANANDPLTAPLAQLLADRDFRNKPISDPKASQYFGSDLPQSEQQANQAKWLGRAYLPPEINSMIDVADAAQGKPDRYGKVRNVPQALIRAGGIKIEQATPEIVKNQQDKSAYFDAQTPAFNRLKAVEKAAVLQIPKYEPDDTQAKMDKYRTYLSYPNVYNYFKEIAVNKVNGDTSKIDPIYTYPYSDVRKYMLYQSLGGSDLGSADAKALYKAEPIIGEISKARSNYFELNPIEGAANQTSRPIASDYAQSQMDAGNWNDPEVQNFLNANNAWKNMQREKMGLPPLASYGGGFGSYAKKPKKVSFKIAKVKKPKAFKVKLSKAPKFKMPKNTFKLTTSKKPKVPVYKVSKPKIKFSKKFSLTS